MLILGIDPGLARTGWAILRKKPQPQLIKWGCITTSSKKKSSQRLLETYQELQAIIKVSRPQVVAVEKLFFNTNAKTAFMIGEARGVIKICAELHHLPIIEFTPLQIKNSVVGYGRADKRQVQEMVKTQLGLKEIPRPDDAADAVAVALTYCFYKKKLESDRK